MSEPEYVKITARFLEADYAKLEAKSKEMGISINSLLGILARNCDALQISFSHPQRISQLDLQNGYHTPRKRD